MGIKTTIVLDEQLFTDAKELVGQGLFKSFNAFVSSAAEKMIEEIKRRQYEADIVEASKDPLFLADVDDFLQTFEPASIEDLVELYKNEDK